MTEVQGCCPACGGASLFLGEGGHVTCSRLDCPNPCAADDLLHGEEAALARLLGGTRTARVIAHTLHFHGHSLANVRRMTDEQLRAVPGVGDESLASIRAAIPAPEQPASQRSIEDVVRLESALHVLRYALDRFMQVGYNPAPEYLRDLLDKVTGDPGEPCERGEQYERAEAAEAVIARIRRESARIRSITPTWGPVADLIDAALNDPDVDRSDGLRLTVTQHESQENE